MTKQAVVLGCVAALALSAAAQAEELPPGHPPLDQLAGKKAPPLPAGGQTSLPSGHPAVGTAATAPEAQPSEQELLKQLDAAKGLKESEKPYEVSGALGKLYYGRARYKDAADFLDQAVRAAEPTRTFYLEQRRKALAAKKPLPNSVAGCERTESATLSSLTAAAREKAKAGDPAAGASCALVALGPVRESYAMLANARYLGGDAAAALAARDRQLETFDGDTEARFARAAMLLDAHGDDVKALARAKADFSTVVKLDAAGARGTRAQAFLDRVDRALAAGGLTALVGKEAEASRAAAPAATAAPAAARDEVVITPQMMEAVKNTERTPELEAGFLKLLDEAEEHLARGRYQEALSNCARVVPFEPDNARAKSSMAWALVQLDRQPMGDRVWGLAVGADPSALERLGDVLKTKGDSVGAKRLWAKLAQSAPSYASSSKLGEKLK